ncbi:Udp-glycosyltransferase superfamily protein [Thalictrum thalictroides]|uniref:Udp-glycosyltransferase superfamily protein n=1 Tax=Thalictrum thalictroides TaxID=46969 RepID=A0A7J6WE66_THATH|nr:Udp-glycosyltransferase superfamily protein [Thalictrum thalictroides]
MSKEGWNLAELFHVRCVVVAAPYVVPYSAPSSFERRFKKNIPILYKYLQRVLTHGDPITGLPTTHDWAPSPLLL